MRKCYTSELFFSPPTETCLLIIETALNATKTQSPCRGPQRTREQGGLQQTILRESPLLARASSYHLRIQAHCGQLSVLFLFLLFQKKQEIQIFLHDFLTSYIPSHFLFKYPTTSYLPSGFTWWANCWPHLLYSNYL